MNTLRWMIVLALLLLGVGLVASPAAALCVSEPCSGPEDCVTAIRTACTANMRIQVVSP